MVLGENLPLVGEDDLLHDGETEAATAAVEHLSEGRGGGPIGRGAGGQSVSWGWRFGICTDGGDGRSGAGRIRPIKPLKHMGQGFRGKTTALI